MKRSSFIASFAMVVLLGSLAGAHAVAAQTADGPRATSVGVLRSTPSTSGGGSSSSSGGGGSSSSSGSSAAAVPLSAQGVTFSDATLVADGVSRQTATLSFTGSAADLDVARLIINMEDSATHPALGAYEVRQSSPGVFTFRKRSRFNAEHVILHASESSVVEANGLVHVNIVFSVHPTIHFGGLQVTPTDIIGSSASYFFRGSDINGNTISSGAWIHETGEDFDVTVHSVYRPAKYLNTHVNEPVMTANGQMRQIIDVRFDSDPVKLETLRVMIGDSLGMLGSFAVNQHSRAVYTFEERTRGGNEHVELLVNESEIIVKPNETIYRFIFTIDPSALAQGPRTQLGVDIFYRDISNYNDFLYNQAFYQVR